MASPLVDVDQKPREFVFDVKNKSNEPWAAVTLLADSQLSKQVPVVAQGQDVSGFVVLNLSSSDCVQQVSVSVRGHVITGAGPSEDFLFLDHTNILWPPQDNTSKYLSASKTQSEFRWPFAIKLPTQVLQHGGPGERERLYTLPGSFFERHTRPSVEYEVVLIIQLRKTFFKSEKKINAPFLYHPIMAPEPFSRLRELAYREDKPIPDPKMDPDGWHVLDTVRMSGSFASRSFTASVTLALANPLSYTRGTPLPCFITFECNDTEALYILSDPRSIVLRVQRRIQHRRHLVHDADDPSNKDSIQLSELATWWLMEEGSTLTRQRLMGEVLLHDELKPSAAMAHFRLEYSVMLFASDHPSLVFPSSAPSTPLLFQQVTIGTSSGSNPVPISQARYLSPPSDAGQ